MAELTKEDLAYIFEVAVLSLEGKPLTEMMCMVKSKHILIGKQILEEIKERW